MVEAWNETIPSSDIVLTARARRLRWIKRTVQNGCTCSVSFHAREWRKWVGDMPNKPELARAIAGNKPYRVSHNGKIVTLTPPVSI